jgi:hypothetical protein
VRHCLCDLINLGHYTPSHAHIWRTSMPNNRQFIRVSLIDHPYYAAHRTSAHIKANIWCGGGIAHMRQYTAYPRVCTSYSLVRISQPVGVTKIVCSN